MQWLPLWQVGPPSTTTTKTDIFHDFHLYSGYAYDRWDLFYNNNKHKNWHISCMKFVSMKYVRKTQYEICQVKSVRYAWKLSELSWKLWDYEKRFSPDKFHATNKRELKKSYNSFFEFWKLSKKQLIYRHFKFGTIPKY